MAKKTLIEQYINKHTKELEASIKIIEPKLIEAFVRVYGEKHRKHITYIIKDIKYIFFISESFIEEIKDNVGTRKSYKKIMERYLKYIRDASFKFKCVSIEHEKEYIVKKFLPRFPFAIEDYEYFADSIECDTPCCMALARKDKETLEPNFVILLPIFAIDIKIIIHEINHALGANPLCINDNDMLVDFLFRKEIPEELENDFIAELVLQEFLKIGGVIPKNLKRLPIGNAYKEKDYIVKYLFDNFDYLILKARISQNYNLFYKILGQENAFYLTDLIEELYNNFTEDKFFELLSLINELLKRVEELEIVTPEEYLCQLENAGYKIRRLKKKEV